MHGATFMKSAKERQRAYRERCKQQKKADLIALKILTSVSTGKKLEILSMIDNTDTGRILGQAVDLLWSKRFGDVGTVEDKVIEPEKIKRKKPEKGKKKEDKSKRGAKAKSGADLVKNKSGNSSMAVA